MVRQCSQIEKSLCLSGFVDEQQTGVNVVRVARPLSFEIDRVQGCCSTNVLTTAQAIAATTAQCLRLGYNRGKDNA